MRCRWRVAEEEEADLSEEHKPKNSNSIRDLACVLDFHPRSGILPTGSFRVITLVSMTDTLSREQRSALMARVRRKDTAPELVVRRLLYAEGYRYRLHKRDLPGSPDIVFVSARKVIFVHGCFWHRHTNCRLATTPKSRSIFWQRKFVDNVRRDERNRRALSLLGWRSLVVWQCQTRRPMSLKSRLVRFLS